MVHMLSRTLPNGMKVIVDPSHTAKVVSAQVWVQVGSADELSEEAGLAHVHEHMLFKGTERRKVGEIAGEVEGAGGEINAYTSFDQTVYYVNIASQEVDVALDILADAVQHSAFDKDELSRELEVVLEELRRGKDSPGRVCSELLFGQVFKQHNYGRPVIGYQEVVERFTRDAILAFYRKWYQPHNMLLVVSGDVDPEFIIQRAQALFPNPESRVLPERPRVPESQQESIRYADERMDVNETYLSMGWHGPALSHPDTPAIGVLSILLGNGESSRLYRRVRREQELVTDAYAYAYTPKDPGLIGCGAQIQGRSVVDAVAGVLKETYRLRFEAPSEAEIEKAKTIVLSEAIYSAQTVQGRARRCGYFEMVGGGLDFEKKYRDAVKLVTPEDVQKVAQRWLRPEGLSVVLVRPKEDTELLNEEVVKAIGAKVYSELESEYALPKIEGLDLGIKRAQLSNGAQVIIQPDASVPLVSIAAVSKGGLLSESESTAGVSNLVSELLVRGTERYSAEQISDMCDAMAGGVGGQSGRNSLGLRGEFLKDTWAQGLDIFTSCLLEPTFSSNEIERERKTALEDLASRGDHSGTVAFDAFNKAMYGEHPYSWPTIGTEKSIKSLTRDEILQAYRKQLNPSQLTVTVVGDVSVPEVLARLETSIGRAQPYPEAKSFTLPTLSEFRAEPFKQEIYRDKEQAQLVMGFPGLTMDDPRRFSLEILTQILSGQSGRLFYELRDRQSLAYSVGCMSLEGLVPGYLVLHIGTHPSKLPVAEKGLRQEVERITQELVQESELLRAQRYLIGSYEIGLQRASARANIMALNEAYGLGYDEHLRHADALKRVTRESVREIAQQLVQFNRVTQVVVRSQGSTAE